MLDWYVVCDSFLVLPFGSSRALCTMIGNYSVLTGLAGVVGLLGWGILLLVHSLYVY